MRTNYKKCNRKTHYRVRRGIIVKYSTCARAMWRRRGGGLSAGRRELGAVGAGQGGARWRCGWRAVLPWRLSGLGSGSGLRAARLSWRCISDGVRRRRSGCPARVAVASRAVRWSVGRGCNSGGARLLVSWSGVGGSTLRAVRLPGALSLGALGGSLGASASRGCNRSGGARGAALRGCQGLTVGAAQPSTGCLQLARGRECVCSAFKRLLDALYGRGGVLVRVSTASGLEGKYGALTCERGRGCFWA